MATRVQEARQFGDDAHVITIFTAAYHHPIQLAITHHGIKGAHQFSAVLAPRVTKGIPLYAGRATVMHAQDPGRTIGFQVRRGRTGHQAQTADIGKLQHQISSIELGKYPGVDPSNAPVNAWHRMQAYECYCAGRVRQHNGQIQAPKHTAV
jgi:hypothetical protein